MSNILFLVEGEVTEEKYFSVIKNAFKKRIKSNIKFFYYKTNIYALYDEIKEDKYLNTIDLLKDIAKKRKDSSNLQVLDSINFGEIYLFFDLDPQDDRFTIAKIEEMLTLFDNETEHGKLYINYPMVESFKHFKTLPDSNYNNYKIKIEDCPKYKHYVSSLSCINDYTKISQDQCLMIIRQNLIKVCLLINDTIECDFDGYRDELTQKNIFQIQREEIDSTGELYIINSLCLWPLDYFPREVFENINEMNNI
ncbi:MAG: hypothetical protein IJ220_04320 [Clostridia bacterium]|nr:hypothetical protein [Clostridia bacterium]